MLREIDACIKKILTDAEAHGCHITQMAIGGVSSGAHLAMLYAYSQQSPLPIKFVVDQVGPTDLREIFQVDAAELEHMRTDTMSGIGKKRVQETSDLAFIMSGRHIPFDSITKPLLDSLLYKASPVSAVSDSTPPTVMAYGGTDNIVKLRHKEVLVELLSVHKVPHVAFVLPRSGHTLANDKEIVEEFHDTIYSFARRYFGF